MTLTQQERDSVARRMFNVKEEDLSPYSLELLEERINKLIKEEECG